MPEGLGIDMRRVHEDGLDLYQALNSPGGESAMIEIVMLRSDDHLREVMRYYERSYRKNFARAMIEKSQNLVVCFVLRLRLLRRSIVLMLSNRARLSRIFSTAR